MLTTKQHGRQPRGCTSQNRIQYNQQKLIGGFSVRMAHVRSAEQSVVETLVPQQRTKIDPSADQDFYSFPRLVKHVDELFLAKVTQLYRERIPEGAVVLDLCSSWVSHLPNDVKYSRVIGHGMNAEELSRNKQLTEFFVRDLNQDPLGWALNSGTIDAVVCCVSIPDGWFASCQLLTVQSFFALRVQYLQYPEKVFSEIGRVLKPGGLCIMTFSNRMFYSKAITAWRELSEPMRCKLVKDYYAAAQVFEPAEILDSMELPQMKPQGTAFEQATQRVRNIICTALNGDPFYAVIAQKKTEV